MSSSLAACYIDCCLRKLLSLYTDLPRLTFKKKNHFILLSTSNDIPYSCDKTKLFLLFPLPFQHPLSLYTHAPSPPWFPDPVTRIWPLLCVSGPLPESDLWMRSSCSIATVFSSLRSLRSLLKGHHLRQDCTHQLRQVSISVFITAIALATELSRLCPQCHSALPPVPVTS